MSMDAPTLSAVLACLWVVVAAVLAAMFRGRTLWRCAYGLIAIAVPVAIWLFLTNGPWLGLAFLAAALSILRWPVIYLWRWLTQGRRTPDDHA